MRPAPGSMRAIAAAFVASAWIALVAGSGGCEVAVGSAVPGFACVPGPDSCPYPQVCNAMTNHCETSCMVAGCKTGTCDPASNVCVAADSGVVETGPGDVQSEPDTTAADTMMQVDSNMADTAPPPDTSMMEMIGPCRGLGCPCSGASSCDSQICADSLTATPGLYAAAGNTNFCTQPCCTSADCDASTVCFATGQGGNYCVNPTWIGRTPGSGMGAGGATCTLPRDCRSALCGSGGHCVDTCCSSAGESTECAGGATCSFGNFAGAVTIDKNYSASCGQTSGSPNGSSCFMPSDCESNICAAAMGESSNHCRAACRGSADCATGGTYAGYCNYVLGQTGTPTPVLAVCFTGSPGNLAMGQTCSTTSDMCLGFCGVSSKCTDVCFSNADCSAVSGWRCRPETIAVQGGGSYSVLACGT